MNVVADRLFSLLLGWTRGLFNNVWNLVNNHAPGISGFLERSWLPIILVVLLAGTVTDYLVWIVRWRPHYVWRSWFMRRHQKKRLDATQAYMNDLDQAPLDLDYGIVEDPPFSPVMPYEGAEDYSGEINFSSYDYPYPQPYTLQEAWQNPSAAYPPSQAPDDTVLASEPALLSQAWGAPEPAIGQEAQWWTGDAAYTPYQPMQDHQEPMAAESEKPVSRRRRRTLSKRQRQPGLFKSLRETLFDPLEPDEPLDSLPPPISQEDAFHEPYYPVNYHYRSVSEEENENQQ